MNYKSKRLASAKIARKLGAAISTAALVAPVALPALQPMVALAYTPEPDTTDEEAYSGITLAYDTKAIKTATLAFKGTSGFAHWDGAGWAWYDGDATDVDPKDLESVTVWLADGAKTKGTVADFYAGENVAEGIAVSSGEGDKCFTLAGDDLKKLKLGTDPAVIAIDVDFKIDLKNVFPVTEESDYTVEVEKADGSTVTIDENTASAEIRYADFATATAKPDTGKSFSYWEYNGVLDDEQMLDPVIDKDELDAILEDDQYKTFDAAATALNDTEFEAEVADAALSVAFNKDENIYSLEYVKVNADDKRELVDDSVAFEGGFETVKVKPVLTNQATADGTVFAGWVDGDGKLVSGQDGNDKFTIGIAAVKEAAGDEDEFALEVYPTWTTAVGVDDIVEGSFTFAPYAKDGSGDPIPSTYYGTVEFNGKHATWSKSKKTGVITFEFAGDTGSREVLVTDVTAVPNKGNVLKGWYVMKDGKLSDDPISTEETLTAEEIEANANISRSDATKRTGTSFVALFDRENAGDEYTISFDANGGTLRDGVLEDLDPIEATIGVLGDLPVLGAYYERAGFEAFCWNTKADGSGKNVSITAQLDTLGAKGDVTVYGTWTPLADTKAITAENAKLLDADGNEVAELAYGYSKKTQNLAGSATANLETGYTLTGWKIMAKGAKASTAQDLYDVRPDGSLNKNAKFSGATVPAAVLQANAKEIAAQEVVVIAEVKANDYTLVCNGVVHQYTVGVDAPLPEAMQEGEWMIQGGAPVKTKADLDALATEDGTTLIAVQVTPAARGWYRGTDGRWYFEEEKGGQLVNKTGWYKDPSNSEWYYLKGDGAMARSEWIKDAGKWYYLNGEGVMLRHQGVKLDDHWYWLKDQGEMAQDETINIGYGDYTYNHLGEWVAYEEAKKA